MNYAPDLPTAIADEILHATLPGRRLHYRQRMASLVYIHLDQANGGVIRDLSEGGMAIQAVAPLRLDQTVHLRFDLRPRLHLETQGRIAWIDARGQAGVQFLGLAERSRRLLKEWIFTQLLDRARQVGEMGFSFLSHSAGHTDELFFSAVPHAPIRVDAQSALHSFDAVEPVGILRWPWCPFALSLQTLSHLTDGLILLSAILLFFVLSMSITHTFPAWPFALAFIGAVTGLITGAYWFLFEVCLGITPGEYLAWCAVKDGEHKEERPRFR